MMNSRRSFFRSVVSAPLVAHLLPDGVATVKTTLHRPVCCGSLMSVRPSALICYCPRCGDSVTMREWYATAKDRV